MVLTMLWEMPFAVYVVNLVRYDHYSVKRQGNFGSFPPNFDLCLCTIQEVLFV